MFKLLLCQLKTESEYHDSGLDRTWKCHKGKYMWKYVENMWKYVEICVPGKNLIFRNRQERKVFQKAFCGHELFSGTVQMYHWCSIIYGKHSNTSILNIMWICWIIFRPDAVENHAIGEDPDVKVRLQDVVETSDLLIPEIEICSQHVLPHSVSLNCGSVKIDFWTF